MSRNRQHIPEAVWAEPRNSDSDRQAAIAVWLVSCEYRWWGVW